jgi:hypothetical protein
LKAVLRIRIGAEPVEGGIGSRVCVPRSRDTGGVEESGYRNDPRVEGADAVAPELHRQFQPACTKVAHLQHAISIELMLNTERPGEDFRQDGIVNKGRR